MNDGSARKQWGQLIVTSSGCLLLLAASAHAGPLHAGDRWPGTWQRRDVIIDLRNLPKRYSCNDLWYKFRDVLLRLGASSRMDILPYRCERRAGAASRSPSVRLEYYVPRPLASRSSQGADFTAVVRDVQIAPGEPASIDAADCALVRQMRPALPGQILRYRLQCRAPPATAEPTFSITVRALIPQESATVPVGGQSR